MYRGYFMVHIALSAFILRETCGNWRMALERNFNAIVTTTKRKQQDCFHSVKKVRVYRFHECEILFLWNVPTSGETLTMFFISRGQTMIPMIYLEIMMNVAIFRMHGKYHFSCFEISISPKFLPIATTVMITIFR